MGDQEYLRTLGTNSQQASERVEYVHRALIVDWMAEHGVVNEVTRYEYLRLCYCGNSVHWQDEQSTKYSCSFTQSPEELEAEFTIVVW